MALKKEWLWIIGLSLCIVLLLPWLLSRGEQRIGDEDGVQIRVKLRDGTVQTMNLEEYLVGVVAAEMPAEFEIEALKSQAIAARTYALKHIQRQSGEDRGYDVDTTVNTQAWISEEEMRAKWGFIGFRRYHARIEKAVKETEGIVVTYNGELADTFYHSSSGRKPTERPEEVWSASRPYLTNVDSMEAEPLRIVKTYTFTPEALFHKLDISESPRPLTEQDFLVISRTTAGRLRHVRILGKGFLATELRAKLGLASTDIEWSVSPHQVVFKTYGNGHAVGMSQYGANDMARNGYTYEQILQHYYPGTRLTFLADKT